MKKSSIKIITFIVVLFLVTVACSFSASTAKITEAFTARDNNGTPEETSSFAQDEIFYCLVTLANAPDDTVVKASWYAVDAEGFEPNDMLYEDEYTGGGKLTFQLSAKQLWPAGKYKVELYLNDKLDRTLEFTVEASSVMITKAFTVRDNNGKPEETSSFAQDEIFYCLVTVANAPDDTVVKALWYAVDAEGNYLLSENEYIGGGEMTFNLSYEQLWPVGKYKIELYLNGELDRTLEFSVE